jgi:hypothetical protein
MDADFQGGQEGEDLQTMPQIPVSKTINQQESNASHS